LAVIFTASFGTAWLPVPSIQPAGYFKQALRIPISSVSFSTARTVFMLPFTRVAPSAVDTASFKGLAFQRSSSSSCKPSLPSRASRPDADAYMSAYSLQALCDSFGGAHPSSILISRILLRFSELVCQSGEPILATTCRYSRISRRRQHSGTLTMLLGTSTQTRPC